MGKIDPDKYVHGPECKYGHGTLRFKSNGKCPQCLYAHKRRMHANLPPEVKTPALAPIELPADNPLHFHGQACKHGHGTLRYKSNRACVECQKLAIQEWSATQILEGRKLYSQASNLAKVRKYKAAKSKRVPTWADLKKIKEFYANCPAGMVVDHIIPLRGKLVSGFHVHNNLQYLTPEQNVAKGNRFDPDRDS